VTQVLIILAALATYVAFVLVKPDKSCGKCSGWGHKTRRRRPKACSRCQGTGTVFYPGAPLVHRGAALAVRYARERSEGDRLWREGHGRAPAPGRPAAG
jgi:DnaJ-class molecular chaperone